MDTKAVSWSLPCDMVEAIKELAESSRRNYGLQLCYLIDLGFINSKKRSLALDHRKWSEVNRVVTWRVAIETISLIKSSAMREKRTISNQVIIFVSAALKVLENENKPKKSKK